MGLESDRVLTLEVGHIFVIVVVNPVLGPLLILFVKLGEVVVPAEFGPLLFNVAGLKA